MDTCRLQNEAPALHEARRRRPCRGKTRCAWRRRLLRATIRGQHADTGTCKPPGTSSTPPSQSPRALVTKHRSPRTARMPPAAGLAASRCPPWCLMPPYVPCRLPLEVRAAADAPRRPAATPAAHPAARRSNVRPPVHTPKAALRRTARDAATASVHPWQLTTAPSPKKAGTRCHLFWSR